MQERELEVTGGSLYYEIKHNYIVITHWQGMGSEVKVPDEIEDFRVKEIAKKAFLSKKNLRKVILPPTVEEIGDWAFAYCDQLEQVTILGKNVRFGKAVFLDCNNLKSLQLADNNNTDVRNDTVMNTKNESANEKNEAIAALLAAAVTTMQASYLLNLEEAGSQEWLIKWDARMLELLNRPDEEGFSKQVLCGEEDYGSTDMNTFLNEKRKGKVRLLLLRCLYDVGLDVKLRQQLEEYLRTHTKGCGSEETWQVIFKEHGNDRKYYQLFVETACLTEDNFQSIIADMGEEYPEMKAYFMRYKEEQIGYQDFFEELEL